MKIKEWSDTTIVGFAVAMFVVCLCLGVWLSNIEHGKAITTSNQMVEEWQLSKIPVTGTNILTLTNRQLIQIGNAVVIPMSDTEFDVLKTNYHSRLLTNNIKFHVK